MKFAPGTSQEDIDKGINNWMSQIGGDKAYAGGTPNFNERTGNYTDEAKSRLTQRDQKRTEFVNGFKSKFGGGMRKAGDYLAAFAQDPKNSSFLSGSKDLRNGIRNSQDSNEPSAVMKTMGATSNKTTSATPTTAKPAASTASTAVTSSGYDPWVNGIPSAKERTEMYEATLTGASKDNFRKEKVATDKYGNKSPQQSNYDFYMQLYTQEENDAKWMETYTGPKTWEDTAGYSTSGAGAAQRTADYMKQVLKYQKAERTLKQTQEYYAKKKKG